MKIARILVLVIAVVAGGLAALLAGRSQKPAEQAPAPAPQIQTVSILVAKTDIGMGQVLSAQDLRWQVWPLEAANSSYIRQTDKPKAIEQLSGSIARTPFTAGEPIRESKLISANGSGFMAAILPPGTRAISTQISPETGAGGFILPNDHVDVILTRRDKEAEKSSGVEVHTSETILKNIRVLAIDQTIQEKDGQRVVVGKTATLEVTPRQAETLALAHQLGSLSLALRSIADVNAPQVDDNQPDARRGGINMVRFGVTSVATPK